jgi:D-xylose 1-dehydrogenase (NADP+, D-xylono-1,5-lactone-forming)
MSTRILRWGLLGTARINQALITPLRASPRNKLVAVASRSAGRAADYAQEWQIPRYFGSYEAMLADPDVDVVYVSLPNSLHAEWAVKAAQAGKHVLCEKPLAVTLDEADAIIGAGRAAGVLIAEAFMYRHHPQTLKVKEIVDSGVLGQLALVRGAFTFSIDDENDVRLNSSLAGGALWDVGCYPVSYARTMIGAEPREVFGRQVTGAGGVDETFLGQLAFPGGVYAQFDCGFRAPNRTHMEIVGTEGTLTVPSPFKPRLDEHVYLRRGDDVETIEIPGQELYLGEVEDLADAILEGRAPRVSLGWSRANAAVLLALYDSARSGRPVNLA